MPVITTYKTIYASFAVVDSTSLTAPSTSPSLEARAPISQSGTEEERDNILPKIIACVVGIMATLVLIVAAVIVIRSRLKAKKAAAQFQENSRAAASTPQQPAPRLKPLSFLQGREGPKEWIPGGSGNKEAGGGQKNASRRTLSIRKSILSRASRISKMIIPQTPTPDAASDATLGGRSGGVVVPESDPNSIELSNLQQPATLSRNPTQSSIEQFQAKGIRRRSSAGQPQQRMAPVETTIKFERKVQAPEGESSKDALIKALNIESPPPLKTTFSMTTVLTTGEQEAGRGSKRVSRLPSTYQTWMNITKNEEGKHAIRIPRTPATSSNKKTTQVKINQFNRAVPPKPKAMDTGRRTPITPIWFDDDDDDAYTLPKRTTKLVG